MKKTSAIKVFAIAVMFITLFSSCSNTLEQTTPDISTSTFGDTSDISSETATGVITDEASREQFTPVGKALLENAKFHLTEFKPWPVDGNETWNARAFFTLNLAVDNLDESGKVIGDDYEGYTWRLYIYETGKGREMKGPYTVEKRGVLREKHLGYSVYRISLSDCPEGDPTEIFELGKDYTFIIVVSKTGKTDQYAVLEHTWDSLDANGLELYNRYWDRHDREVGYTAKNHPISKEDNEDAIELGLSFDSFEGNLIGSVAFESDNFTTWPYNPNNDYCARAFYQTVFKLSESKGDYTKDLGTSDYKYKWTLYYHDAECYAEDVFDYNLAYEATPISYEKSDNGEVIYRLSAGDFTKDFQVGRTYMILITLTGENDYHVFSYLPCKWTEELAAQRDLYNTFWERHDRTEGITSDLHKVTPEDIQDANRLGFDEEGNYIK